MESHLTARRVAVYLYCGSIQFSFGVTEVVSPETELTSLDGVCEEKRRQRREVCEIERMIEGAREK